MKECTLIVVYWWHLCPTKLACIDEQWRRDDERVCLLCMWLTSPIMYCLLNWFHNLWIQMEGQPIWYWGALLLQFFHAGRVNDVSIWNWSLSNDYQLKIAERWKPYKDFLWINLLNVYGHWNDLENWHESVMNLTIFFLCCLTSTEDFAASGLSAYHAEFWSHEFWISYFCLLFWRV